MAATLDQIENFLRARRLSFQRASEPGRIVVPLESGPSAALQVVVALEEEGRFIKILAPWLFVYADGPYKPLLLQTLLLISHETKMLQWEYDPIDGEVRAIIEFPLEDAPLTERQFFRAFDGLVRLVNVCRPRIQNVIEAGVDPGRAGHDTGTDRLTRDFVDFLRRRAETPAEDARPAPIDDAPEEL